MIFGGFRDTMLNFYRFLTFEEWGYVGALCGADTDTARHITISYTSMISVKHWSVIDLIRIFTTPNIKDFLRSRLSVNTFLVSFAFLNLCWFRFGLVPVCSSDAENVAEEHRKYARTVSEPLQAGDAEQQEVAGRRKPALVRWRTLVSLRSSFAVWLYLRISVCLQVKDLRSLSANSGPDRIRL